MSKIKNIKKALRVEALLKDSFTDTPDVHISVHAVEERAVSVHASHEWTGETYSAEHLSNRVSMQDLYRHCLHPLDSWVDAQERCPR